MTSRYKPQILVWKDLESLSLAAAHFFVKACHEALADHGYFSVGLSGGSTPRRLYQLLATPRFSRNIPWKKVFLFWSDERFVPPTDADSNYRMTKESLLDHVPVPSKNIYRVPTQGKPAACAEKYERQLRKFLGKRSGFDWMLLGMGADGHTASLFPHTDILKEKKRWVKEVWVEEKNTYRISFTYPLINRSRNAVFLVAGAEKSPVIQAIKSGRHKKVLYPVQGIQLLKGAITWMLDEAASGVKE